MPPPWLRWRSRASRACPSSCWATARAAVISSVYALDYQSELAGLICESFAFQVFAPDLVLSILRGVSRVLPRARVLKLPNQDFSRDPAVVRAMDEDPLLAGEVQPARTVAAMLGGNDRLRQEFPRITLPVLILHGAADKVTRPSGSRLFHERAGSRDKTLKLYDGHAHDLLGDLGKEVVLADITAWIEARLPGK
jgi:acylglycerol lipase